MYDIFHKIFAVITHAKDRFLGIINVSSSQARRRGRPSILAAGLLVVFPVTAFFGGVFEELKALLSERNWVTARVTEPAAHELPENSHSVAALELPTSFDGVHELKSDSFYDGLPVDDVEVHEAKNAWGTVVFLPQYHQLPGSQPEDPENDRAEQTQRETYKIVKKISDAAGTTVIAIEGELAGEVSEEKKARLSQTIGDRNDYVRNMNTLSDKVADESIHPELEKRIFENSRRAITQIDREVYLKGAPMKLWSEKEGVKLFGLENLATREKSADIVREHIYLQDRLQSLSRGNVPGGFEQILSRSFSLADYESLMRSLSGGAHSAGDLQKDLDALGDYAEEKGRADVAEVVDLMERSWASLSNASNAPASLPAPKSFRGMSPTSAGTPSRANNPFAHIQDRATIERLLKENENKIEVVVVEQRNTETAENFAEILKSEDQTIGILQYGAGHTEGLTRELLKQGLTVITVTPTEVEKYKGEK